MTQVEIRDALSWTDTKICLLELALQGLTDQIDEEDNNGLSWLLTEIRHDIEKISQALEHVEFMTDDVILFTEMTFQSLQARN